MNVVMVGLYPPHIGGIASYVYNLREALIRLGVSVHVVTYGKVDGFKVLQESKPESEPLDPGVHGTFVTQKMRGGSFLISGTVKTLQVVRENDIDVIHAHYLVPPGLVGVLAKKISGVPLMVTCHGSDVFVFSRGWKTVISQYVTRNADSVSCNSRATASALQETTGVHPTYVPSGVDTTRFTPLHLEREAVTYVGALTPVKGVDTFLKAMKGINEKVWIVGDGPERPYLESLANTLGLDCTFWGFRTDTPQLMNRSKVLVLPSRHEGLGLTLLEAMACQTPVIGRNTGGIPELLTGRNGLLFDTEEELHKKVKILLENNSFREKISTEGFKTASQWSWDNTAREFLELYHQIIPHVS
ncbi:MAG: glycosyltransferase [Theionarchaea archaeon]|nr:glycosyltransferase [Theionarchaea archaeon]MBU6999854.1 glycosyltransferase [Theionarchaea archaeon]MBU7020044.1 glycosyltransferase [Theionarchaea archaeon]MBU7036256.1 glycosyltransferase [Theionarchaea archaeon]MBU7039540.1 glycosyltransferase [Theionarchaea archaeon]